MQKKILFTASLSGHFKTFHLPYLKWFQEKGYETHVACNGNEILPFVDKQWQVDFIRSPYSIDHFKAFKQLKKIINAEKFTLINCHTPMASVLTRLASFKARENGTKLIYTAHGFHFFNGASIINWLFYYPIELLLSKYTDAIICINNEDFTRIERRGSAKCEYFQIPGIGVKGDDFYPISRSEKIDLRVSKGFITTDFIIIYAAEFIHRKNHQFIIDTVRRNKEKLNGVKILFAGSGKLQDDLEKLVQNYNLGHIIEFIGYRKDIDEVYKMSDLGISASKQEGLGLNLVEEMMCGLPVVATVDRGHKEVVDHNVNGFLFEQNNHKQFLNYILKIKNESELRNEFSSAAIVKASKFELQNSLKELSTIYSVFLK